MNKEKRKYFQDFIKRLLINQIILTNQNKITTQQNIEKRAEWLMCKYIKSDFDLSRLYFSARRYISKMYYSKALKS